MPDTGALRALATTYRSRADAIRAEASDLSTTIADTPWVGFAADAARAAGGDALRQMRSDANQHDTVAAALDAHADAVDEKLALLALIRDQYLGFLDDLRDLADDAGGGLLDALGDGLDALGDGLGALGDGLGALGDGLGDLLSGGDDGGSISFDDIFDGLSDGIPAVDDLGWLQVTVPDITVVAEAVSR